MQTIRLFDYCFRQGVFDACEMEDDYAVQEFYDKMMETGGYGLLLEPNDGFNWRRWQHTLYHFCRMGRIGSMTDSYVNLIHRYKNTFVFSLIPMTMRFYLEGIKEWLDYPNPNAMQLFKQTKKQHWTPNLPSHVRTLKTQDYIFILQGFVYERKEKHYPEDSVP